MMKHIFCLFLAGLMLLSTAACIAKQQNTPTADPTAVPTVTEKPTEAPTVTEEPTAAPAEIKTVNAATVEELLAAIASHTEVVLSSGVYDLSADEADGILRLQNLNDFRITGEQGTVIKSDLDYVNVLSAQSCSGLVLSGITVCGCGENLISIQQCSDVRIENCALKSGDGEWEPNGIGMQDSSSVSISDCSVDGCLIGVYAMDSKAIKVAGCEIRNIGSACWWNSCEDVLVSDCSMHDIWYAEAVPGEPEGDASFLICVDGQGNTVQFSDCEIYGNTCTYLFGFCGECEAVLSGLNVHDNDVDLLFSVDEIAETPGKYAIANCDVSRNAIRVFLFCGLSETEVAFSGTSVRDNRIDGLFLSGDITVSGCEFADNTVARYFGLEPDSYYVNTLTVSVHDSEGNELDEAGLTGMTLAR